MENTNAFWNWNGQYVGYRLSDFLFTSRGRQLGYFAEGDEVYGCGGEYIGEIRGQSRLITNLSKKKWTRGSVSPQARNGTSPGHPDVSPKPMLSGFEDFPVPSTAA